MAVDGDGAIIGFDCADDDDVVSDQHAALTELEHPGDPATAEQFAVRGGTAPVTDGEARWIADEIAVVTNLIERAQRAAAAHECTHVARLLRTQI